MFRLFTIFPSNFGVVSVYSSNIYMSTISKLANPRKMSAVKKIDEGVLIYLRAGNIELMFLFASVCFVLSLIVLGSRTVDRLIDCKSLCVVTIGRLFVSFWS